MTSAFVHSELLSTALCCTYLALIAQLSCWCFVKHESRMTAWNALQHLTPLQKAAAACPFTGVVELEPSMTWNPQVIAGIGAVTDPTQLHKDIHGYLAGGCQLCPKTASMQFCGLQIWQPSKNSKSRWLHICLSRSLVCSFVQTHRGGLCSIAVSQVCCSKKAVRPSRHHVWDTGGEGIKATLIRLQPVSLYPC